MQFINLHTHNSTSATVDSLPVFSMSMSSLDAQILLNAEAISVGIHPWFINEEKLSNELRALEKIAEKNSVIAIGECGLDRSKKQIASIEIQKSCLLSQITIAKKQSKPLIIHCVKAYSDFIEIIKSEPQALFIFHDFTANSLIASKLYSLNCYFSFGSRLMFSEKTISCFKEIDLNRCFFETDDSECTIEDIYNFASQIKNTAVENLKCQIIENFKVVFMEKTWSKSKKNK